MKKITQFVLAIMIMPFFVPLAQAVAGFIGNSINIASFGGGSVSLGSKSSANSMPVVIASDQGVVTVTGAGGTFPVTGTFWQATQPVSLLTGSTIGLTPGTSVYISGNVARNVPTQTAVGATTSNATLLAANANRVGLECDADCNNTDRVFVNWGTSAATNTMKRIEVCSSWQPPMVSTVAIQVISNSGTQNIRCTEYSNQ